MQRIYMLLVALSFAVSVKPAFGQTQESRAQAEAYFQKAEALKQEAEELAARAEELRQAGDAAAAEREAASAQAKYRESASNYYRAFNLSRFPVLVFNMAQMYRLGGDEKNALAAYKSYVELEPSGEPSDQARQFITELERVLAEKEKLTPQEPSVIDRGSESSEPVEADTSEGIEEPGDGAIGGLGAGSVDQPRDSAPGRGLRIAGIASVGVGVLAFGLGVKFGLNASSASDDLSSKTSGPWAAADEELIDTGESAERNMIIAYSLGSAAVIAGGVLYYLGHRVGRTEQEAAVTFQPTLTSSYVGLSVSTRF